MAEKLLIIEPDGPQGVKLGFGIGSVDQIRSLDEAVGQLPEDQRKNLGKIREIAIGIGISIVKP